MADYQNEDTSNRYESFDVKSIIVEESMRNGIILEFDDAYHYKVACTKRVWGNVRGKPRFKTVQKRYHISDVIPGAVFVIDVVIIDKSTEQVLKSNLRGVYTYRYNDEEHEMFLNNIFSQVDNAKRPAVLNRCMTTSRLQEVFNHKNNGVCKKMLEGNSGNRGNRVVTKLSGTFLGCRTMDDGSLLTFSPFGKYRFTFKPREILNQSTRMYVASLHCYGPGKPHYVTIVITEDGSPSDRYCKDSKLRHISHNDNPFLTFDLDENNNAVNLKSAFRLREGGGDVYLDLLVCDTPVVCRLDRLEKVEHRVFGDGRRSEGEGTPNWMSCDVCDVLLKRANRLQKADGLTIVTA